MKKTFKVNEAAGGEGGDDKKSSHQKRGGKGMPKGKKERVPSKVVVGREKRKGNKYVTTISGLGANEIDLETARKFFANKFSCGCSKGEQDELIIQGDVVESLFDVIPEKFPSVSSMCILFIFVSLFFDDLSIDHRGYDRRERVQIKESSKF